MVKNAAPTELGSKKISSLLEQYAIPAIIAMTASSLYNMVDSIFIGHIPGVGALALSGLSVTFPLMNISAALGTLVGVGASTMISVLLGRKEYEKASRVLSNEFTLNVIIGLIFTAVSIIWLNPILRFFGASDNSLPFAHDYMLIIAAGNVITHLYFGLNSVIRASGNPKTAMYLTVFTVTANAVLDPLFINVFGLGIKGAAIATILCQAMALSFSLWYFSDKKNVVHFRGNILAIDWPIAKDSLAIGMGPFLMNLASCLVVLFINRQMGAYGGDLAIAAFGINHRVSFVFIMIAMGFNQGMQPIAGYNYGARLYSRVRDVYKLTALCATIALTLGFLVSVLIPMQVVSIFTDDPPLEEISAHGLRIANLMFPVVGFQIVTTNLFQSLGMVRKSIFLSLTRQLLFLLPFLYFLPGIVGGVDGVWWSFPASDLISTITTGAFAIVLLRKIDKVNDGDDPALIGGTL